jgi:hypothetical protein
VLILTGQLWIQGGAGRLLSARKGDMLDPR